jgi:hypothetical protein
VLVADFKTGHGRVTPARDNWQLRFLALAAARTYGCSSAHVALVYVHGEEVRFDRASLSAFDLDAAAADLRQIVAQVVRADDAIAQRRVPNLALGDHCRYCPAFLLCPAQTALVRAIAEQPGALHDEVTSLLTPSSAAEAYRRLKAAHLVLHHLERRLHAYATVHPIDLGDGVVFGPVETTRRTVDGAVAWQTLVERYGAQVADAACSRHATQASIEDALRPVAQRLDVPLARLKRETLETIDERGGLLTHASAPVKEHRPRRAARTTEETS